LTQAVRALEEAAIRKLIETLCSVLAALALFGIMWLTLFDVSGRKFLSESIPGSLELTELMMVVVIFAGLPLVSLRGEHVVFDSLDALLAPWLRRTQQLLIDAFCAVVLALLGWRMWVKADRMLEYGDKTQQLGITLGYFVHLMAVLIMLTALVHVLLMLRPVAHHHPGVGDGATT
jgi:TRAP-type C4-dicarboxylate transport system permease small subunit